MVNPKLCRIPQCDRCQYNAFSEYLVCALHPGGPDGAPCQDFEPWPAGLGEFPDLGYPEAGLEVHASALSRLSLLEQLEQIESHPMFSGHCPQCGHKLGHGPRLTWNCDRCGWEDSLTASP
ncbi:hypothetical protein [Lyngbya confervoides]|uniref:Cysteine-rich CPCC domain-containing protein n=1 Tax=Lyngbya confervoides BDU141951 TaxID=1574623 RepID=A0ABD4T8R7_9CYAN|nr:hypothetical protein [Lyngbya confervoides]MCM1985143.1 hypothetical protein [Lyngbya confervoides BDU141951]